MNVLLTGDRGYLGSVANCELARQGLEVAGLDAGFYSDRSLFAEPAKEIQSLRKDVRDVAAADFDDVDAVIHLAELSNDPLGQLVPEVTQDINHLGSVRLAELAREAGVQRFVYMSSCSVYGVASDDFVDETSPVNPQTTYAVCKTLVERDVAALATDDFSPTFLRNATAFGASPHMRFDIVLNNLAGLAYTTREIKMISDGTPWRPLVHARDIAQAIVEVLQAPREAIHNQIFNVGSTEQNYRVREIAEIVADVFPGCQLSFGPKDPDNRSYRVSFEKIRKHLPNFKCQWDVRRGVEELYELFKKIDLTTEMFEHRCFTRLKQLQYLLETGQIDEKFLWKTDSKPRNPLNREIRG